MTDKLQHDIERGERARLMLADPLVSEAREHIEAELWRLFKEATPADKTALEHIKAMQYFHAKYFAFFQQAITNGKLASINVDSRKKSLRERVFG
jgi:hypothetical protein